MALPNVNIIIGNGGLGRIAATNDSVCGIILSGVAVAGKIAVSEPKQIFALEEAVALGLDAAYDTANSLKAYKHIRDFYSQAPSGTPLWIMLVPAATLMADIVDTTLTQAKKLLDAASGNIRMLGITRVPPGAYAPVITQGIDPDVIAALPKAQALAAEYAAAYRPFRCLLEGRAFDGNPGTLYNLRAGTQNRVGVVIGQTEATGKCAAVGLALGRFARVPVQENIGKVKRGELGLLNAYFTDNKAISEYNIGAWAQISDKGYIFMRSYPGRNGFYFNDDHAATALTDDYYSLANGRVIDKVASLAYATYVEEILSELVLDEEGKISPALARYYESLLERVLTLQMVNNGELSATSAEMDANQNILVTSKLAIRSGNVPVAYARNIEVTLQLVNPR